MNRHPQSDIVWVQVRNPNCDLCSLHETAEKVCLPGDGPVPCDAMIVGEAPGFREENVEIPFSGKSGLLLRKTLKEIGLDPREIFICNVVSCHPPNNRKPKKSEAKTCAKNYLDPQVQLVKPKVVLLLGNVPLEWATGKKGTITKVQGIPFMKDGVIYVPSIHPSYVIRSEDDSKKYSYLLEQFKRNLFTFKDSLQGDEGKESQPRIQLIKELPELEPGKPVFHDVESNGLNPFLETSRIWCDAFGQSEDSVYTIALHKNPERLEQIAQVLRDHPIIAHRATHEAIFFKKHTGVRPDIYFDTKLGAYIMDENEPSGLKHQAVTKLNVPPWDTQIDFEDPDWDTMLPYNHLDNVYMQRLYTEIQLPYFREHPKMARLMKYILLPAMEIFTDVIINGFHIDMKMANEKLEVCHENLDKLSIQISDIAGRSVNPGSPKQMVELLYEDLGLKCPVRTKKGKPSSSEAALIRLAGKHEIIDVLLEWRKWKKYQSTYLTPWMSRGPVLHANYGFTATDTGRLNSTMVKNKRGEKKAGATLHQCPRDTFIRNLISPRGYSPFKWTEPKPEDWCILAADLSQAELRLVADASGDRAMCSIFNSDGDIHLETARTLQPFGEIEEETRKKAKAVNFGFVYGMWARKFVAYAKEKFGIDLTLHEGEIYREAFFDKYDGLEPWHRRTEALVSNRGFIDSVFGRRRRLPNALPDSGVDEWIQRESVRQGINSPIQSAASDLNLFIAVLLLSPKIPWKFKVDQHRAFLVGSAHDSLIFECLKAYAAELRDGIKYTIKNLPGAIEKYFHFLFKVPIKMDVDTYLTHWKGEKFKI